MRNLLLFLIYFFPTVIFAQTWEWVDRVAGSGNNYVFTVRANNEDGSVYSTGRVKNAGTFGEISTPVSPPLFGDRDVFLTKHDKDGNLQWVKRFGGLYTEYGQAIEFYDGYIYLMGYFTDTVIVDNSDTLISNGAQDLFISKFDENGNLIFLKSFGGSGVDLVFASEVDENGNFYFVGSFEGTIDFDGVTLVNTINTTTYPTASAAFVLKTDSDGNTIWAKKQQSTKDVVHTDIIKHDGYVYVTGYYNGITEFHPGVTLTKISSFWESSLTKFSEDGDFVWVKGFGGNYSDILASIDFDANNQIYVGGMYRGTATYQTEILSTPASYLNNGMVVKLDTSGTVLDSYTFPSSSSGQVESIKIVEDKLYIGGYFSDSLFVNNDTILGHGLYDIVIYCLDTTLDFQWTSFQGGASYDQIRNIDVFEDHSIVFGGSIKNSITFPTVSFTTIASTYDGVMGLVTPPLEARLSNYDSIACTGDQIVIFNKTIGNADNVTWDAGGLNVVSSNSDSIVLAANTSGVYQVKLNVSNLNESDSVFSGFIYYTPLADVNIASDSIIGCLGDSELIEATGVFDAVTWSTSETDPLITVNNTDWYTVNATVQGTCADSDSVFVSFNVNYPNISIAEDSIHACPGQEVELSATGVYDELLWSDMSSNSSIMVMSQGWYNVTGNNADLCFTSDSVWVDFDLSVPIVSIAEDSIHACVGQQVELSAVGAYDELLWSDLSSGTSITVMSSGWYNVTGNIADLCYATDSVRVDFDIPDPSVSIAEDSIHACPGQEVELSATGVYDELLWSDLSSNSSITVMSSGWYNVTGNNADLCYETDSVRVDFDLMVPNVQLEATDSLFCEGQGIVISANGLFDDILWGTSEITTDIAVNSSGWYTVLVSTADGCEAQDSIFVQQTNCLGISPNETVSITVFHKGTFTGVVFAPDVELTSFELITLSGQKLERGIVENGQIILGNELAVGYYILVLDGVWASKFLIAD